jgi:hypothetical protein
MELEEIKNIWSEMNQKPNKQIGLTYNNFDDVRQLKYNKQANIFKGGEVIGLLVAYTLAGIILYKFNVLDKWYLIMSGIILVIYLLVMPLYTITGIMRMKKIDLVNSNYKEVLEHFYSTKSRLKQAEKISLIASPFLFVASTFILVKIFTDINLFVLDIQLHILFFIGIAFLGAILFNVWAFKKRNEKLKSVKKLLEEDN